MSNDPLNKISETLLEVLACPVCKAPVTEFFHGKETSLKCSECRRIYPIRDGIPIMLESETIIVE